MAEVDDVVEGAVKHLKTVVDAHHDDAPLESKQFEKKFKKQQQECKC